jgi:malate/lactate dehydrogenase
MALLKVNKKIVEAIASKLGKIEGDPVIVTLTNPVDLMNYIMYGKTGLDRRRVLGSAGMLDSARFRMVLSRRYLTSILKVKAYVIGEHGNNQVPVFSQAEINGERKIFNEKERTETLKELRQLALNVISKKGATVFAPANNTANMVETILRNEKKTTICSIIPDGEYGLRNVSIGLPVTLGRKGFETILEWKLDKEEKNSLIEGAEHLKATLRDLFN